MTFFFAANIFGKGSIVWTYFLLKNYLKENKDKITIFANKFLINYLKSKNIRNNSINYISTSILSSYLFFLKKKNFNFKKIFILGDYPLPFIQNQIVYVNQANLIKPNIYRFSSKKINFIIRRFYFYLFYKNVKLFYVQSMFMKKYICKSYRIDNKKIIVKIPEIIIPRKKHTKIKNKNLFKFLYPVNYYTYKNFSLLGNLKSQYKLDYCDIYLLKGTENFINNSHSFKYIDHYDNKDVYKVYSKFDCILYPSLVESCGLPLLEAKNFNMPVICPNLPYAREINLKKVFYFNPDSVKSLFVAINKFIYEY
jgi:hypothetical protein